MFNCQHKPNISTFTYVIVKSDMTLQATPIFKVVCHCSSLSLNMTSYKDQVMCHIESMMENSSCHGGNWILKLQDLKTKSAASLLLFLLQSFVIFLLLHSLFVVQKDFTTSIQWNNEDLVYPNITICNPRLFDKEKVRSRFQTLHFLKFLIEYR